MFLMDSSPVTKKLCNDSGTDSSDVQYRGPSYVLLQNTAGVQRFRKYSAINLHDVVGKMKDPFEIFLDGIRNPETD